MPAFVFALLLVVYWLPGESSAGGSGTSVHSWGLQRLRHDSSTTKINPGATEALGGLLMLQGDPSLPGGTRGVAASLSSKRPPRAPSLPTQRESPSSGAVALPLVCSLH